MPTETSANEKIHGRDVFILGAGFSKAIASQMPTMEELGTEVRERLKDFTDISSVIPASLGKNFELWMTYLSQPQPWLSQPEIDLHRSLAGRIRQSIVDVIQERTSESSTANVPGWLQKLVLSWHQREAVVITLNYDTLVEIAGRDLKVSENTDKLFLVDIYPPYFSDITSRTGEGNWGNLRERDFRLIKLHGSVNWHYSGRDDFHGETIYFSDVSGFGLTSDENSRTDHIRDPQDMAADKETLIIPPVAEKTAYFNNETVKGIWKDAAAALRDAAALYIVGYSLPVSDLGMSFFLSGNSPPAETPVHVVDIDDEVLGRYKQVLQRSEMPTDYLGSDDPVIRMALDYTGLTKKSA